MGLVRPSIRMSYSKKKKGSNLTKNESERDNKKNRNKRIIDK